MYDNLSLTQWVQGFCRNILEEDSTESKDQIISYLSYLMEDATVFLWQGAKAAHAVLLCEMERGSLQWENGDRIDRICRAHAQKHVPANRSNWGRNKKLTTAHKLKIMKSMGTFTSTYVPFFLVPWEAVRTF